MTCPAIGRIGGNCAMRTQDTFSVRIEDAIPPISHLVKTPFYRHTNDCSSNMGLRLGNTAPDFDAETTVGPINFHEWIGNSWVCLIKMFFLIFQLKWLGYFVLPPRRFHPRLHYRTWRSCPAGPRLRQTQREGYRNICQQSSRPPQLGKRYQRIWC